MLYNLFSSLYSAEVLKYISSRSCLAAFTAFFISIFFGRWFIKKLRALNVGEDTTKKDSEELKRMHCDKKNTPTMGGIIVIASVLISTLLWCNIYNEYILLSLFTLIWLGVLGFIDDYIKLTQKKCTGFDGCVEAAVSISVGAYFGVDSVFPF